jgi:Lon-like protease
MPGLRLDPEPRAVSVDPPAPTATDVLPPAPDDPEAMATARRRRRRRIGLGVTALGIGGLALAGFVVRLPYVLISPGEATPLNGSVVMIEGAPTYEHQGDFLFLTVRVSTSRPNVYRVIDGWLDDDITVRPEEDVLGGLSFEESEVINTVAMQQSQDYAKKVALEELGYDVTVKRSGALVLAVADGSPASGELRVGDIITGVDGQTIRSANQIAPLVQAEQPGDDVVFTVRRGEQTSDVTVEAGRNPETGDTYVGVSTQTLERYEYPIDVQIDTRDVGGPSAGLAFTLAIVDDLTPGDLTGGENVAVTGAIRPNGKVTDVGGVEQKAAVARQQGAVLMLAPRSEVDLAERTAGDMPVVGVRDIDDALRALEEIGGARVPDAA